MEIISDFSYRCGQQDPGGPVSLCEGGISPQPHLRLHWARDPRQSHPLVPRHHPPQHRRQGRGQHRVGQGDDDVSVLAQSPPSPHSLGGLLCCVLLPPPPPSSRDDKETESCNSAESSSQNILKASPIFASLKP